MCYYVSPCKTLADCYTALLTVSALLDAAAYAVMKLPGEGNLN